PGPPAGHGPAGRLRVAAALGTRRGLVAALAAVLLVLGTGVWYIGAGQFTRVPATGVLGKTPAQAERRLADEGLDVGSTREEYSGAYERGTVMGTDPAPGERVRGNGSVDLVVSRGPRIVEVPELRGRPLAAAKGLLRRAGLAVGVVTEEFDGGVAKGSVVGSDPPAGTERSPDAAVALVVSKGAPIDVPAVVGRPLAGARAALADAGFRVEVAGERVHSPHPAGSVAAQSLPGGARAAEGDTVTLTLSKGPRPVTVPDVTGEDVEEAVRRLEAAGFEVRVEKAFPYLGDTVEAQSVPGGGTAPEGSGITIRVEGI
ncbi:Stk1 family PASTA domain-containing Ser/Thr kinase, partial [Streptomyces somaliensis]